jgi:membrane fusion protein (multidrug efflux system)
MKNIEKLVLLLILAFLLGCGVAGCGDREGRAQEHAQANITEDRSVKVSVMKVKPQPVRDILILPGQTMPFLDVTLPADQDGIVEWIGPREGHTVKQGDLVAKIDVSTLKAQLDSAEAAYSLADKLFKRRKALYDRKIISKEELDTARTERDMNLANVRQARVRYEQGLVRSPIDGVVNDVHVEVGEFVARGGRIADLVNVDKIKIEVSVPELDVRFLKAGDMVLFNVDAIPNRDFGGVIDFVSLKADPATKTFKVQVLVENTNQVIRPGMIARVAFLRRVIPEAIVVPLFALVDKGGERVVYVEKDGVAESRTVSLGVIEGDRIQITRGLKPGDNLIVTGQTEVQDGGPVKVEE